MYEFPAENHIDEVNLLCFDKIATEFDDREHMTCRNFDVCTEKFLNTLVKKIALPDEFRYLDVGVGTGKSLESKIGDSGSMLFADYLYRANGELEVIDISKKMIDITKGKFTHNEIDYHALSIFQFRPQRKYDLIVASMCAPFLTPSFLSKVYDELLENRGTLLISYPAGEYIDNTREDRLKATFKDKIGNKWESYSFYWDNNHLLDKLMKIGFSIIFKESIMLSELSKLVECRYLNEKSLEILKTKGDSSFCDCVIVQKP